MRQNVSMLKAAGICLACAVLALLPGTAAAADPQPNARALLEQMYEATGSAAWDRLAGAELSGDYQAGGLSGSFHQSVDLSEGRDVLTYDVGATRGAQATLPTSSWWTDDKGLTTVQDGPEAAADAATQSYADRNGWFHPSADEAPTFIGERTDQGRIFDLVSVRPAGGRMVTLWIDAISHRLDRAVVLDSAQRETTTTYGDYRQIAGVWFPYLQRTSNGDPGADTVAVVRQLTFAPESNTTFVPPPSVVKDAKLLGDAPAATIPFRLDDGLIVVDVAVNGGAPLPFVLDSGALNVMTPEAAKALHLNASGHLSATGVGSDAVTAGLAHVDDYRVGPAELTDQSFVVLALPAELTNAGAGEPPIAGLIGYEFLRRFVVRVDYQRRELTVSWPGEGPPSHGARLPLHFDSRDSFIVASAGGAEGYFGIDTGDDGAVTLFKSFFAAHRIPIELPGLRGFQGGVGGVTSTLTTRIPSLTVGPYAVPRPITELNASASGAFASTLLAGNLGSQVFQNFVLTFDYPHQALYVERSTAFGAPMPYNRTGLHIGLDDLGHLMVKGVSKGSPADIAGIVQGETLLALNGHSVSGQSLATVDGWLLVGAGRTLTVDLMRGGKPQVVTLTARELLPPSGPFQLAPGPLN
ncbi:MAG TPA: aspartyl protease family protein [Caulobacteraceae bacterium]